MGRDWKHYWGGGMGTTDGRRRRTKSNNHNHDIASPSAASGCCINAVFHLFDFQSSFCHHHDVTHELQQQQQPYSITIKGAEAPRNSLEIDPPMPMPMEAYAEALNIPVGIQIKTGPSRTGDLSSACSSPSLKTPNLVARLMGLDLLPDQTTPLSSSMKSHNKFILDIDFMGSRSLPETPRISSNLQDCRRLSLQINRENKVSGPMAEEFEQSRNSTGRRDVRVLDEENRSPGFYARQMVKRVKVNASRKVGSDITNTVKNRHLSDHQKQRIHDSDQLVLSKSNKHGARSISDESASSSSSPRLRFLELKNRGVNPGRVDNPRQKHQSSSEQKCGETRKEIRRDQVLSIHIPNRRPSETLKNKKEETFFQSKAQTKKEQRPSFRKCKKTPLSIELHSSSNAPKLFYVKKDPDPLYPLTKQEYDDGRSSERRVTVKERNSGAVGHLSMTEKWTAGINSIEKTVFERLDTGTISYHRSPCLPKMSLRCNRLLIFDLVNEFLELELSRQELGLDRDRVLEDINAIIESDLRGGGRKPVMVGEEEEREVIMEKIERELLDKLVKETTTLLYYDGVVPEGRA